MSVIIDSIILPAMHAITHDFRTDLLCKMHSRLLSWLMILLTAGCATLPDMADLQQKTEASERLTIIGQKGLLSQEKSQALLRQLQQEGKTDLLERHFAFMQAIHSQPLVAGNTARLLIDGPATHRAMFDAIASAQDHVNLETYIFDDEGIGASLAKLLLEKKSQGVAINVMYDSVGSLDTEKEFFQKLQAQGINICEFNPVNPLRGRLFSLNHRDHRKILVVDGRIGYTGGINISSVYSRSSAIRKKRSRNGAPWRDTHIEIRGPAVSDFQHFFIDSWQHQRCPELSEKNYFPLLKKQGDTLVRILASSPMDEMNHIYVELLSAMMHAELSIHMTAAYFVPDVQTIDTLKQAAGRGVDVRLILPSFSDYSITFHAGRSFYTELLQSGVKIYERKGALLHAKTAVIDGVWSTVGSTNIDLRSFLYNDEINVMVLGRDFAQEMEQLFVTDLSAAMPIELAAWERRSFSDKFKEDFARMWALWL